MFGDHKSPGASRPFRQIYMQPPEPADCSARCLARPELSSRASACWEAAREAGSHPGGARRKANACRARVCRRASSTRQEAALARSGRDRLVVCLWTTSRRARNRPALRSGSRGPSISQVLRVCCPHGHLEGVAELLSFMSTLYTQTVRRSQQKSLFRSHSARGFI